jgi:hypothetical protein
MDNVQNCSSYAILILIYSSHYHAAFIFVLHTCCVYCVFFLENKRETLVVTLISSPREKCLKPMQSWGKYWPEIKQTWRNLLRRAIYFLIYIFPVCFHVWSTRYVVVETLGYKPEGHGFDTRWGEWMSSIYLIFPVTLGPGVYSASNRSEDRKQ